MRERGTVHPRDVDRHFAHGSVTNYWGGSSSATTHLLDDMHYQGLLRIAARENGIRLYAAREWPDDFAGESGRSRVAASPTIAKPKAAMEAALDATVDVAVALYAPVPSPTLAWLVNRLRYGTPQWRAHLPPTLTRAKARLAHARIGGVDWYWPRDEPLTTRRRRTTTPAVRLLAPFDPIVWDRRRFEHFWGWAYRFEAYTPAAKRKLGYYALPLLWGDEVIGWANLQVQNDTLRHDVRFVSGPPADPAFHAALDAELARMRLFLGLSA